MKFIRINGVVFPIDRKEDRLAAEVTLGLLGEKPAAAYYTPSEDTLRTKEPVRLKFSVYPDRGSKKECSNEEYVTPEQ